MEKRFLGGTGLGVAALGFGTMELHLLDEPSAGRILNAALDLGINYIDTSPEYPMAEYYIGRTIAHRRDEFFLATKCCDNMSGIGPAYIFDRATVMKNIDESLRLMKTDHVDLLQLHGVIPEDLAGGEYGEVMEALREVKAAGKALHTGLTVCNKGPGMYGFPAGYGYNSILRFAPWKDIETVQLVYGALTRLSENVIDKAHKEYGTGVIARGIIKSYDATYPERVRRARLSELFGEGEDETSFLVRYAISHPSLSCALTGTKNYLHLENNVRAAEKGPLDPEIYREAKLRLNFAGCIAGPAEMSL